MRGESTVNFNLLHRTCKLVVLLCLLHISVTVVFYVRSLDIRFAFVQNQQSLDHVTLSGYDRKLETKAITQPTAEVQPEPEPEPDLEPEQAELPVKLERCPETSPLLGKTSVFLPLVPESTPKNTRSR